MISLLSICTAYPSPLVLRRAAVTEIIIPEAQTTPFQSVLYSICIVSKILCCIVSKIQNFYSAFSNPIPSECHLLDSRVGHPEDFIQIVLGSMQHTRRAPVHGPTHELAVCLKPHRSERFHVSRTNQFAPLSYDFASLNPHCLPRQLRYCVALAQLKSNRRSTDDASAVCSAF